MRRERELASAFLAGRIHRVLQLGRLRALLRRDGIQRPCLGAAAFVLEPFRHPVERRFVIAAANVDARLQQRHLVLDPIAVVAVERAVRLLHLVGGRIGLPLIDVQPR